MKKQNETIENVKANNVNNNESAATESAKVESANNASDNVDNNATDESKAQATEPTAEEIATAKVETKNESVIKKRYQLEEPKEVEKTKFAGAYVLGVYRPTSDRKNSDKTFYKIFFNGKIFDGFSATEFCDAVGIERKHRAGNTPKAITLLDKLQALKSAIEAIDSDEPDFANFAKIVQTKIVSEQMKNLRVEFVAKYAAAIALFAEISEATCAKIYGAETLALAKKLGYKFADTKATTESK